MKDNNNDWTWAIIKHWGSLEADYEPIRPEVARFAIEMEKVLQKDELKKESAPDLIRKILDNATEALYSISSTAVDDQDFAINVANFAMMIWDNAGGLS